MCIRDRLESEILEIQERLETITEEGTIYPTQKDGNVKWYVWKNGRREYLLSLIHI